MEALEVRCPVQGGWVHGEWEMLQEDGIWQEWLA
jgi:hypothetical protein